MMYGKNWFGRMLAALLCVVLLGSIAMPVGAANCRFGDLNRDNQVNAADALIVLQYSVDIISLDDESIHYGDADNSRTTDAEDALWILKFAVSGVEARVWDIYTYICPGMLRGGDLPDDRPIHLDKDIELPND